MASPKSSESAVLDRILRQVRIPRNSGLKLGIGDDCAIFRPRGAAEDLLFTTDLLLEDVHFRRDTHSAEDIGYKALARGLSDIAAMGGEPRFCLLSLAVPRWANRAWGGDPILSRTAASGAADRRGAWPAVTWARAAQLSCDSRGVRGCAARPRPVAQPGASGRFHLCLRTPGRLGPGSCRRRGERGAYICARSRGWLWAGSFADRLHATAAMDLSDGLSLDLRRIALASGELSRDRSAADISWRLARSGAPRRRGLRTAVYRGAAHSSAR